MRFLMWAGVTMIAGCNGPAFALGPDPQPQQRLMAIFAHPDDELPVAPLLARYAREGRIVQIIYATRGDLSAP
ncbi:MAG: PIG-L family deacetylase, partial [Sphingorhabdus sp.]